MRIRLLALVVFGLFVGRGLAQNSLAQGAPDEPPLDSQSEAFVAALAESESPGFHELPPAEARQAFASLAPLFGAGPQEVIVEDRKISESIPIRIYKPEREKSGPLPAVVYFHGGGWVLGSIETHDALCRRLCSQSAAAVISVDYRLAPEHPFPAPLNDCFTATSYIYQHARQLGLDSDRIVVAGDSAGGNLAAAVALKARDESGPPLLAQVLIYPALNSDGDSASYSMFADGFGLTQAGMQWFWEQYLGDHGASAYASPSKATSLEGLPATLLVTAQYDVLRDEGETYAQRLDKAGVQIWQRRYDGVVHGFIHFAGVFDRGQQATAEIAIELQRLFRNDK